MQRTTEMVVATMINAIPINRLMAICEDFALGSEPTETIDVLRQWVRAHVVNLSDGLTPVVAPPVDPEKKSGLRIKKPSQDFAPFAPKRRIVLQRRK